MRIAEIFHSIQGEGGFTGTPSVFVRTTGCNLRCWFCDTPYTSWAPEGAARDWRSVLEEVRRFDCEHVVVTGGEPFLQPEVVPLTHALADAGHFVTIETAATIDRPAHADLMSISPKLANSTPAESPWNARHEARRDAPAVVARFVRDYAHQLKFVIDRPEDVADVETWLARQPTIDSENVWLMPQATTAEMLREKQPWLDAIASRRGWRVSPRLHVELFGNVRGK
ncbi:MAG: 7-carboxy-7-deazaguanine synthase QueE [Planctomycetaceae bacterium]